MRRIRYKCLEWRCVQQSKLENSYSLHNVPSTVLLRSLLNTSLTDEANVKEVDDSDVNEALMLYQNLVRDVLSKLLNITVLKTLCNE